MMTPSWELVALLLSAPHVYYFILWFAPSLWCGLCKSLKADPSYLMFIVATLLKIVQFSSWSWFYLAHCPENAFAEIMANGGLLRMIVALALILVGQVLNFGSTSALGIDGIYYGYRFGKTIPWCTKWPYGGPLAVPHPQYIGANTSIIGVTLLTTTQAHFDVGYHYICIAWCLYYVFSGITEEFVHQLDWAAQKKRSS